MLFLNALDYTIPYYTILYYTILVIRHPSGVVVVASSQTTITKYQVLFVIVVAEIVREFGS